MSKGDIVQNGHRHHHFVGKPGHSPATPQVASFHIDIPTNYRMASEGHLLVYYVQDDGEVVADTMDFNVEKCLQNQVRNLDQWPLP